MADYRDRLRVLLLEKDFDFCRMFVDVMNRLGTFSVDVIYYSEQLVEYVSECHYSVVIADKKLISASDIEYVFSHNINPLKYPGGTEIILIGDDIENDRMYRIGNSKPMYYLRRPVDYDFLKTLVLMINECQSLKKDLIAAQNKPKTLEACVLGMLKSMGVPSSMKGHTFLTTAIKAAVIKPTVLDYVTKLLYPGVAKLHETMPSTVERGIRHVIEISWDRGDTDMLKEVFGYTINRKRGKPTNSEFIAMVAEYIRLNYADLLYDDASDMYADIIG